MNQLRSAGRLSSMYSYLTALYPYMSTLAPTRLLKLNFVDVELIVKSLETVDIHCNLHTLNRW